MTYFYNFSDFFFYFGGVSESHLIFFFSLFYFLILFMATLVIANKNAVYAVLSLISVFLFSALFMLLLKVEFLMFMFLIVYIGAIAVFFLFIVMMVNFKIRLKLDLGEAVFASALVNIFYFLFVYALPNTGETKLIVFLKNSSKSIVSKPFDGFRNCFLIKDYELLGFNNLLFFDDLTNIRQIGLFLYTHYTIPFILCGFILFIAIIGCVLLTEETKTIGYKKQRIHDQLLKKYYNTLLLTKKKTS